MFRLIPLKSSSRQLVRFSLCSTTSARNGSHAPAAHGFDRQLAYPKIGTFIFIHTHTHTLESKYASYFNRKKRNCWIWY